MLTVFQVKIRWISLQAAVLERLTDGEMIEALKAIVRQAQNIMHRVVEVAPDAGSAGE